MSMKSINQWTAEWAKEKGLTTFYVPSVASTNSWSKKEFTSGAAVFLAEHQTEGRGRGNHLWKNSTAGSTLLSTWCYNLKTQAQPLTNLRIGLALFEALYSLDPSLDLAIKAPNDIYITEGKLAGILSEVVTDGNRTTLHIGIGLNVFEKPLLEEQATVCWTEHSSLTKENWFHFCDNLHSRFLIIVQDPSREQLIPEEQVELLFGLKKYFDNDIVRVERDGTLALSDGTLLSWNEL